MDMKQLINFLKDEQGASGVEYGIMVAAVAAVIIVVAFSIGGKVKGAFDTVDTGLGAP
jgi:pilus assembly protein Flp/PilA